MTVFLLDALLAQRGWGGGWWLGHVIGWVVFLAVLGVITWLVLRTLDRRRPRPTDTARQLLAERFARGEIDEEEYKARLGAL